MNAAEIFGALLEPAGRADPYPLYESLHGLGDVVEAVPGIFVVTGFDAVNSVLRDPAFRVTDAERMDREFPGWREHPAVNMDSILNLNMPAHGRIRRLITQAFTLRRVSSLEPAIAAMTDRLLDGLAARAGGGAPVEFMHDFAFLLPVTVICELLGVPEADRASFRPLARALTATLELNVDRPTLEAADLAAVTVRDYFADLAAERRRDPRDDLISAMVTITDAGDGRLSEDELLENLALLLVAGFETTTNLLGNGLRVLLLDPAAGRAVRDRSVPAEAVVEEILRYDSPVQLTSRRRPDPAEVGGLAVPGGAEVLTLLGAANRDPRRFAGPGTFDPSRPDAGLVSFGAGPHFCLGAALARLEGKVAFQRLLDRFPRLAPAGEPERRDGLVLRGFETQPISVG